MPPPDFCTARFSGGLVEIHSSVKLVDTSYSSGNTDGVHGVTRRFYTVRSTMSGWTQCLPFSGCHLVPFLQPCDEAALEDAFPEVLPDWEEEFSL